MDDDCRKLTSHIFLLCLGFDFFFKQFVLYCFAPTLGLIVTLSRRGQLSIKGLQFGVTRNGPRAIIKITEVDIEKSWEMQKGRGHR